MLMGAGALGMRWGMCFKGKPQKGSERCQWPRRKQFLQASIRCSKREAEYTHFYKKQISVFSPNVS